MIDTYVGDDEEVKKEIKLIKNRLAAIDVSLVMFLVAHAKLSGSDKIKRATYPSAKRLLENQIKNGLNIEDEDDLEIIYEGIESINV